MTESPLTGYALEIIYHNINYGWVVKDGTVMPAISSQPRTSLELDDVIAPVCLVIKLDVDVKRQSSHALTTVNVEQVTSVKILTHRAQKMNCSSSEDDDLT